MDVDAASQPDILGSMTDMSSIADGTFDAVYSSHSIEHLYPHEVPVALAEFKRVLKPSGFALVTCPDLQSISALIADGNLTGTAYESPMGPISPLDILYGHRTSMAAGRLYMAHRTGFTQASLTAELKDAGFGVVASTCYGAPAFVLWALAYVSPPSESEVLATAKKFFPNASA